ncbi:MAG: cysteine--tRNA ligase [Anaerolineae bacterium]|nr:cysteine--tRNA ligase [Anaerolineae bacterium]
MTLQVFNRMTRQKEEFKPLTEGQVKMYVCGPTVYDHAHIGHAKTYVSFDVINRYLRYSGYRVRYVQNITDVGHLLDTGEDRILKKAGALSLEPMEIVETYTRSYFEDMDALGVRRPNISPRASGHVPEQIKMAQALIEAGYAYATDEGDVYFDVHSWPEYGKLSGQRLEELEGGARVEVAEGKRHPADFALWRHAEPEHLMKWDSPWGVGFPGWHIECSAMATKYLGETFDIHGGGLENRFPHNECEIAQAEALSGKPFANYWLLTGSLTVDGVKMSKSLGNFITVKDAIKTYRPEAIRLFILSSHYSNPVDFSEAALVSAQKGWERLMGAVQLTRYALRDAPEGDAGSGFQVAIDEHRQQFIEAMDDDFNAPQALGVLQNFTREVNTLLNSGEEVGRETLEAIDAVYRELGGDVLGIVPDEISEAGVDAARQDGLIQLLIEMRAQARSEKNFALSDLIRDRLADLGVILEDRPDGTVYKLQ